MLKQLGIAVLALILSSTPLFAQGYNLQTLLQLAEDNNNDLKLARAELRIASAQKLEAVSEILPTIDVDAGYNRNLKENFFYFTTTDSVGQSVSSRFKASFDNEFQLNAALRQTLFSFGKVNYGIQAANIFGNLTEYRYQAQWELVMIEVKKAFYQALLAQKVWEVAQESETSALENYENIKIRYESGASSEYDLLQAEVRWENAIPETMRAGTDYELVLNNLKALANLSFDEEITLDGDLEFHPPMPDALEYQRVLGQRPDYNVLVWEKRLREKQKALELSNHLPTLNGSLIYNYSARSDAFRLDNDNDNWIAGLTLSVPIFAPKNIARVRQAGVEVDKVKTRLDMAEDDIRIDLQNVYLRMREGQQRILAARKSVATARRAFEIAETRVQNGLATQLEFKDSRLFLDETQVTYYSAIFDYLNAYFDWEGVTGNVSISVF